MVLDAIRDPVHKELFVQHFGSEENCAPKRQS